MSSLNCTGSTWTSLISLHDVPVYCDESTIVTLSLPSRPTAAAMREIMVRDMHRCLQSHAMTDEAGKTVVLVIRCVRGFPQCAGTSRLPPLALFEAAVSAWQTACDMARRVASRVAAFTWSRAAKPATCDHPARHLPARCHINCASSTKSARMATCRFAHDFLACTAGVAVHACSIASCMTFQSTHQPYRHPAYRWQVLVRASIVPSSIPLFVTTS